MDLDNFHRRILALLARDGRRSAAAIGREIGLSRPAVQERIATMEAAGVIRGYRTEIAEDAAPVAALLFVRIAVRPCDAALDFLRRQPGVVSVLSLAGEIDALATLSLPSMAELSALNDRVAASPLIESARSTIVLREVRSP